MLQGVGNVLTGMPVKSAVSSPQTALLQAIAAKQSNLAALGDKQVQLKNGASVSLATLVESTLAQNPTYQFAASLNTDVAAQSYKATREILSKLYGQNENNTVERLA
jgi:hypothetical protein